MLCLLAAAAMPTAWVIPNPHVLVFTKTTGFRHDNIPSAIAAIKKMGQEHDFQVDATEDASVFNDENLKKYDLVCFASTTGDILDDNQQKALERFVEGGKGWMGIHSASDTEYDWPWYGQLVGAYFRTHPPGGQHVFVQIENRGNPSTNEMPRFWVRPDEWYEWRENPRGKVIVLASLDESFYKPNPQDHPIAWCHWQGKGRAWYTEMGHFKEAYEEPTYLKHLYGGLMWAAQGSRRLTGSEDVVFKGEDNPDKQFKAISTGNYTLLSLVSTKSFGDCHLHIEFKAGKGASAGLQLQGRYELEVKDSVGAAWNHMAATDCGSILPSQGTSGAPASTNAYDGTDNWNSYDIVFRAPRFRDGHKVENARFVEVRLNGVVVQKNQEVSGSTEKALYTNESGQGPFVIHFGGGQVDFRDVWMKKLSL